MNKQENDAKRIGFYDEVVGEGGKAAYHKRTDTFDRVKLSQQDSTFAWYESEDYNMKEIYCAGELIAIMPNNQCYDHDTGANWLTPQSHLTID